MPLDVSVIIPAYRAESTIRRALRSVAAQTAPPTEVIVVDDGSPDRTAATAEACRAEMGGIALKVVRQQNAGAGAARNQARAYARGEVLVVKAGTSHDERLFAEGLDWRLLLSSAFGDLDCDRSPVKMRSNHDGETALA